MSDLLNENLYDRLGRPITYREYVKLKYETVDENGVEYKRIGYDQFGDTEVSTVWLGLDHGYSRRGAPVIFETMIFGGPLSDETWRYCTEEQARMGHTLISNMVRRKRRGWIKHERDERRHQMKIALREIGTS